MKKVGLLLFLISGCLALTGYGQATYTLRGRVTDAQTGEGVPFAAVSIKGSSSGINTDFEGNYRLQYAPPADSVFVSYVGYARRAKAIVPNQVDQEIDFQIQAEAFQLQEVVVRSGENPAWAILRKIVSQRKVNNPEKYKAWQYESYNKIQIDVNKLSEKFRSRKSVQKMTDIVDQYDQLKGEDGQTIIPVFISESVSDVYFRNDPRKKKEVIRKTKVSGVGLGGDSFVSQLIGSSFQQYNFYNNWLRILEKDFISPVSDSWKLYYDYYLADSIANGTGYDYRIEFEPKRKQDLAFVGSLWVDGASFALTQIDVAISEATNINYIEGLRIQQSYEQVGDSLAWMPAKTRVLIDAEELNKQSAGLLLKFYSANSAYVINQPKNAKFYDTGIELSDDYMEYPPDFWESKRPENLSAGEKLSFQVIDSISTIPVIKTYTEVLNVFVNGYKNIDRWNVDFGPYLYMYAFNDVEGHRFRIGIKTDEDFSKKWIFKGYGAYGLKDKAFKYALGADHIFTRKPWTMAGVHYQYDLERMGVTRETIGSSSIFGAFSRYGNFRRPYLQGDLYAYFRREVAKGLTHQVTIRNRTFDPLFNFVYRTHPEQGDSSPLGRFYRTTELDFESRLARRETFLMNNNERISMGNENAPVVTVRYTIGLKGMLGGDFHYHKLRLNVKQSFRTGFLGRTFYDLTLGYIPSTLPYPLLYTPLGNESWFYVENAFNLMNYFEFISDRYATLRVEHDDSGFILNRIPAVRRLKLRLLATGRVYYGDLSTANQELTPMTDNQGNTVERFKVLGSKPYVELGYGINNIFRVGRIDFVHRLTYRKEPDISKFGVKISFWFNI